VLAESLFVVHELFPRRAAGLRDGQGGGGVPDEVVAAEDGMPHEPRRGAERAGRPARMRLISRGPGE
jgi:hypothetical protein